MKIYGMDIAYTCTFGGAPVGALDTEVAISLKNQQTFMVSAL